LGSAKAAKRDGLADVAPTLQTYAELGKELTSSAGAATPYAGYVRLLLGRAAWDEAMRACK